MWLSYECIIAEFLTSAVRDIVSEAYIDFQERCKERGEIRSMELEDATSKESSRQWEEGIRMSLEDSFSELINPRNFKSTPITEAESVSEDLFNIWKCIVSNRMKFYYRAKLSTLGRNRATALQKFIRVEPKFQNLGVGSIIQRWLNFSTKFEEFWNLKAAVVDSKVKKNSAAEGVALSTDEIDCIDRYSQGRDPSSVFAVDLSIEGLQSVRFLTAFSSLRCVNLNVNKLHSANDLQDLLHLEELLMKDNCLTDIVGISFLPNLRNLQLDINQLDDLSAIEKLTNLISLSASSNLISSLPRLPFSLEKLELYHNRIDCLPKGSFIGTPFLMHIDLGRNFIEYVDGEVLSRCQLLTHLVLSQNRLKEVPALKLPFLRTLWLSGNKIPNFATWSDGKFGVFLPSLEKLFIQDNLIQKVEFGALIHAVSLVELDISFNDIKLIDEAPGLHHDNLRLLYLQDNPILSDDGLISCLGRRFPSLTSLNGALFDRNKTYTADALRMFELHRATGSWVEASSTLKEHNVLHHLFQAMIFEQNIHKLHLKQEKSRATSYGTHQTECATLYESSLKQLLLQQYRDLHSYRFLPHFIDFSNESGNSNRNESMEVVNSSILTVNDHRSFNDVSSCTSWVERPDKEISRCAIIIEKVFRGYAVRSKIRRALRSATYQDDDLDILINDNADLLASFQFPNELVEGWLEYHHDDHIVYPVRPKYVCHERESMVKSAEVDESTIIKEPGDSLSGPRPASTNSDHSIRSTSSAARSESIEACDGVNAVSDTTVKNAWGISDPTFLSTLRKRNKRMRQFSKAQEIRAKDRDPAYRFQKFVKNSGQKTGADLGRAVQDKFGKLRRGFMTVPAWAVNERASIDPDESL